jgi:putative nucleotidyltransferase with HDIG domain
MMEPDGADMQTIVQPLTSRPWALEGLPPFPPVATRILEVLSQEDAVLVQIAELIRMDAAFTAELLRLANSAAYGFASRIDNVARAIMLLGTERVKALTMTVALGVYTSRGKKDEALRRCWLHSLATAFLADELAPGCSLNRDRAYTAGLLHDIGRLGLLVTYPKEYANLIAVAAENSMDVLEVERAMFDIDHCEAGAWLAKDWNFPEELQEAIGSHHSAPAIAGKDVSWLVGLACRLADALGFHVPMPSEPCTADEIRRELPEAAQRALPEDPAHIAGRLQAKISAITG